MKSLENIKKYALNLELLSDKDPNLYSILEELQTLTSSLARTTTATDYTATAADSYIGVTSTASARTIGLPAVASVPVGKTYTIKDESGAANTHNITIDPNASETVDGASTKVISSAYGVVHVISDGSHWFTY